MTPTAAELVASATAILLDFDGPVTQLIPPPLNRQLAEATRRPLSGLALPSAVAQTSDHLAVLRYAGTSAAPMLRAVERIAEAGEVNAAQRSELTEGALEFLTWCTSSNKRVAVVSNNSGEAVTAFLTRRSLDSLVTSIVGRVRERPRLMKPAPHLVERALRELDADAAEAVLIGDSTSDVEAAHACGVRCIGFAKGSAARAVRLRETGAEAVVLSMQELAPEPR